MGVASPLQSGKPIAYWLDGLTTIELVALWDFLSGNRSSLNVLDRDESRESIDTQGEAIREHIYSESLPSNFYACKDRGGLRPSEGDKPPPGVGLYKHRRTRDPPYK